MDKQSHESEKQIEVLRTEFEVKMEYIESMNKLTLAVSGINLIGILFLILRVISGI